MVERVKDRLAVSKQTAKIWNERFSLNKLNKIEGEDQYQVEISNRFT
jgi:hypothetical protein